MHAQGRDYLGLFLLLAAAMALISVIIATGVGGFSALAFFWLLWPLFTAVLFLIKWAAGATERLAGLRLPGLRPGLTLAVVGLATFALVAFRTDGQRCVSQQSMTVVAAADCQNAGSQPGNAPDLWYYGGTGTRIGDSVRGGSLTAPANDGFGGDGDSTGSGSGSGGGGGGDDVGGDSSGSVGGGGDDG